MAGLNLGMGLAKPSVRPAAFNPLSLAPLAFYDFSDLTKMFTTAAGSTPVASNGDRIGRYVDLAGNYNLTAAADANRPTWNTSGGLSWATFDGANAFLNSLLSLTQPFTLVCAVQVGDNAANKVIWGGGSSSYMGFGGTEQPRMYSGTTVTGTGSYLGTDTVLSTLFSGSSSYMRINGTSQIVTGNPGTNTGPDMSLGAFGSGGGNKFVGRIYAAAAFSGALAASPLASLEYWMADKSGAVLT